MIHTMKTPYQSQVTNEFLKQALEQPKILLPDEVLHLPKIIQKYLAFTGAMGKPIVQNFQVKMDIELHKKSSAKPMLGTSEQYNFITNPARFFYLKVKMLGLPVDGLHAYHEQKASMIIRAAGLMNVVEQSGEILDRAETVTVLNDLCLMAPGALADSRLRYEELDKLQCLVRFKNGTHEVTATLYFAEDGSLVNFTSDDRAALQDDGSFKSLLFSTPVKSYQELDGRKVLHLGEAVYHYPEGDFVYGRFQLRNIRYNLSQMQP